MPFVLARLAHLENWRKHMDAKVTQLIADVAAIKTDVKDLADAMDRALAKLGDGIDKEDEAAIVAAASDLENVHTGLQAIVAKAPAATPATTSPPHGPGPTPTPAA